MKEQGKKFKKMFTGVVISDKMDKTVVVKSERTCRHERLGKVMRTSRKYKVHDAEDVAKVGDVVEFYEGRPLSKTKYMYLAKVIKVNSAIK